MPVHQGVKFSNDVYLWLTWNVCRWLLLVTAKKMFPSARACPGYTPMLTITRYCKAETGKKKNVGILWTAHVYEGRYNDEDEKVSTFLEAVLLCSLRQCAEQRNEGEGNHCVSLYSSGRNSINRAVASTLKVVNDPHPTQYHTYSAEQSSSPGSILL